MLYTSTRDKSVKVESAYAIAQGISKDGGLFVPTEIPQIDKSFIDSLVPLSYIERAKKVLSLYLTDFTAEEIDMCVSGAYADGKFSSSKVAPVKKIAEGENILELWRGPTCAFKDMALQLRPYLLTVSAKKTVADKTIVILVATSGDTGKAALEGFKDVPGTKIMVFYPNDGVSPMQKLQMTTQAGENVAVCAINGNFDDAQSGVKTIFTDKDVAAKLDEKGMMFSSANSINWGRLVPQIVYYVSAYCDLIESGTIKNGEEMNVVVPTGNFGNILAAYYAKRMGIPTGKLICASNANNVLTDFLKTGVYDRNRSFYTTSSPSMDILISSNLERLLYLVCGSKTTAEYMKSLNKDGCYTVSPEIKKEMNRYFSGGCCSEKNTSEEIKHIYNDYNYLCDTHTAVGMYCAEEYLAKIDSKRKMLVVSTASPYKFAPSVYSALTGEVLDNELDALDKLESLTGVEIPIPLQGIAKRKIRFDPNNAIKAEDMPKTVLE